ncbi:MAG: ATP-binding protein [Rhodocyclaceae bacterium]|nr:ATP-binding protein [Rhodocyclaceae bacterium]
MVRTEVRPVPEASFRFMLGDSPSLLAVNAQVELLLGFPRANFLDGTVALPERIHADDQDLAAALFSPACQPDHGVFNLRVRQANGRIRCVKALYEKQVEGDRVALDLRLQDAKSLSRTLGDAAMTANFRAMMENTNDFIHFKDRNHVFTGASQTLVELGDPAEHWTDLLGQTDYDVLPEEYADIYYRLEKQIFSGLPVAHEVQGYRSKAGQQGWVDNRKYPIRDDNGEIVGLFGVARDVTEQRRIESTLLNIANFVSQDHGERIFEAMAEFAARQFAVEYVHIALLEPNQVEVRVVAGCLDGQRLEPGYVYALRGTPCENVMQRAHQCYAEHVQQLFPTDHDLVTLHAVGYIGEPIVDNNGQVLGLIVLVSRRALADSEDIVSGMRILAARAAADFAQQRVSRVLQASEQRFRTLFENTPGIAVQGYDSQRRVMFWNQASEALYGYSAAEALGKQLEDLIIPDEMRQNVSDAVSAWIAGGPAIPAGELVLRHKAGSPVPVFSSHVMQTGPAGPEMYCIDISLTEQKRVEAELEQHRNNLEAQVMARTIELVDAKGAAEAANRAKSAFLANMSHELRTPMNAIMGMTGLALRRTDDPKLRDQLGKIDQASQHLLAVINNILDISKIEADRMVLEQTDFQLGTVVENLVSLAGHRASDKGLKFTVDLPADLARLNLVGDPLRLSQILLNLAGNAIKFTPHGSVTVQIRRAADNAAAALLRFEVIDTGIGIAPEVQARLFTAFEQADNSMTRSYGGTGLGLAISKRLVHMMGGEIGVSSKPDSGSTFWFTLRLPLGARAVAPAPGFRKNETEMQIRTRFPGARILLAEDEPINREVLLCLLDAVGLQVDVAPDGQEALDLARRNRYALIMMDMQMPNLNGVDATRGIRADSLNRDTPILATTANAFDEDRQVCLEAGMNDHLPKPIDPPVLFETLLKWLEKPRG